MKVINKLSSCVCMFYIINAKQTKTMVVTRNEGIQAKLEHEGEYLDQVKDFKF